MDSRETILVKQQSAPARVANANAILDLENFGVLPGGTFFGESSDIESDYGDSFSNPYNGNNGYGRLVLLWNFQHSLHLRAIYFITLLLKNNYFLENNIIVINYNGFVVL